MQDQYCNIIENKSSKFIYFEYCLGKMNIENYFQIYELQI